MMHNRITSKEELHQLTQTLLPDEELENGSQRQSQQWLPWALLSCVCFAGSSYFLSKLSQDVMAAKAMSSLASLTAALFLFVWEVSSRSAASEGKGPRLALVAEILFVPKTCQLRRGVRAALLCGVLLCLGQLANLYSFHIAAEHHTNPGVVVAIGSLTSVIGLVGSRLVYGEVPHCSQLLGVGAAVAGVCVVSLTGSLSIDVRMLISSVASAAFLGSKQIISRFVSVNLGIAAFNMINFFIDGLLGLLTMFLGWQGLLVVKYDLHKDLLAYAASLLTALALGALYTAIAKGSIGASVAVSNCCVALLCLIAWALDNEALTPQQIVGVVACVGGVACISLGKK